jgi:hypothetical protein
MPYRKVCKTVQIREPRPYRIKDLLRIATYIAGDANKALVIAALLNHFGLLKHICVLATFLRGVKALMQAVAAFGAAKTLAYYVDVLVQFLAAKNKVNIVKNPRLYLLIAAIIAFLIVLKESLAIIEAVGVGADAISSAIDFVTDVCSLGDDIAAGILTI